MAGSVAALNTFEVAISPAQTTQAKQTTSIFGALVSAFYVSQSDEEETTQEEIRIGHTPAWHASLTAISRSVDQHL